MIHAVRMNDIATYENSARHELRSEPAPRRIGAREAIQQRQADAKQIYRIETGTVVLSCRLPDGRRQIVELLGPGMYLASEELIVNRAEALTPVTLRVLRHREAQKSLQLQQEIDAQLRKRMGAMHRHAVMLGSKTATERLCSFLLECSAPSGSPGAKPSTGTTVRIGLNQGDIADYLGLGPETVCRELKKIKAEGLIALSRDGALTLFDREALAERSEQLLPPKPYRAKRPRLRAPRRAAASHDQLQPDACRLSPTATTTVHSALCEVGDE
jgi:CRP-like cAMP-binding protein